MTKTFNCECGSEVLQLVYDEEFKQLDVSIYSLHNKLSFIQKLKHCWKVLTTGEPYSDQLILNQQSIADIVDFLIEVQNKEK